MSSPRELEAAEYLEKHQIIEFMDNLTSMLFFYRPDLHIGGYSYEQLFKNKKNVLFTIFFYITCLNKVKRIVHPKMKMY
uniref:Si:dkey-42p14.6 n=1 Tax=Sinocyclocheilus anshuiensis TaxID=1608454 RepID=A0A671SZW2_9TELE